ncbi:efflux transporter outer membrane subunit [Hyphomicrobium sp. 2TAF46]|uniref:efflux transporter outer membrane subunit n=1 Tax=Hyphomicrobium sp. 2TAF46 TaxID=3233019 RepID=UPI003F918357
MLGYRWVFAASCASILSGCAVGPNFSPPQPPEVARFTPEPLLSPRSNPEQPKIAGQRFIEGADIPTRWWAAFRSKPLNDLIRLAVDHNPTLQASEAAIRVANYNALAQRGLFFPQVSGNSTTSQTLLSNAGTVFGAPLDSVPQTHYSLVTHQATISFVPDVWGANIRAVENLDALTEQAQFQLEAAHLTLTANVVTAAIQEASLRSQIEGTEQVIKTEREILELLRKQLSAGYAAETDVLAQDAALAQVEQTLPPLRKQLAVQRDQLTALAGQFSADEVLQKFNLKRIELPRNLPVSLPSTLVRRRPDVRAAEAFMHSASAQIGMAIAARLPNFALTANGGTSGYNFAQSFTPGTGFYAVAGAVAAPIFDGFTLYHKQKSAEAALDEADAMYRQTVITAFQNVTDALRSLQQDTPAVQAAIRSEMATKKSLDLIRKQLVLGLINQGTLLTAQQAYFNAVIARVQAEATRLSDVAALFMALGGGWPTNCPTSDWRFCVFEEIQMPATGVTRS